MRRRHLLLPCVLVAVHAAANGAMADAGPGTGGRLNVDAPSGAEIVIDGKPVSSAPLPNPVDASAGPHDVQAVIHGKTQTLHLTVAAGATTAARFQVAEPVATPAQADGPPPAVTSAPQQVDSAPPRPTSSAAKYVTVASLGGLAIVGAGLATGFGISSDQHASNARNIRSQQGAMDYCTLNPNAPTCAQLSSESSAQHADHVVSEVLWIGSGALAVAAVATWFLWSNRRSEERPALQLTPTLSAAGVGFSLSGSL